MTATATTRSSGRKTSTRAWASNASPSSARASQPFDVDTLRSITEKVTALTGAAYGQNHKTDVSLRVITDHIRSATMLIADGVLPSNEGRGYVLRRRLRRAARHGKLLGVPGTFLWEVCATVIEQNKGAYPDLIEKQGYITQIIKTEEENFGKTIDAGMSILTGLLDEHKRKGEAVFSGGGRLQAVRHERLPVDLTSRSPRDRGPDA
jgi:alanyl-tRNA synthetase